MKELNINIPEGYEIDKENSTFECIKFKKINHTIKWNSSRFGVEIQKDGEHFIVSAKPSMVMSWSDAVRFYKDNKVWRLPTKKQFKLIAEHIHEVNALIKANGGYEIRGWHWTADEYNAFCACGVSMRLGYTSYGSKGYDNYVRAVSAL